MCAKERDYMTIGEVVEEIARTHPEVSISKLRFLEEEGLVSPERTPGGYRKYIPSDVARIDLVLRLQKEHFLPLAIIREKLRDFDKGKMPPELKPAAARAETVALPFEDAEVVPVEKAPTMLGLPVSFVRELADFGLVVPRQGDEGDELTRIDVEIAHACWDLRRFGVEPRHLRMYENLADRESALFSQILVPQVRHRTPETRQKLVESIAELTKLTDELKRRLLRRALADAFEDVV
jgi:DNA-binding transcriptional MerR regulator